MAPPSLPVSGQARLMPGVLLLAVGVLAQGTVSLTIEETPEWKACVANPKGCKQLNFMAYSGLEGKIPPSVGDFINLDWLYVCYNVYSLQLICVSRGEHCASCKCMHRWFELYLISSRACTPHFLLEFTLQ